MESLLKNLEELRERVIETWRLLDIDGKQARMVASEARMNAEGFWDNQEEAVRLSRETEDLKREVGDWVDLKKEITDLEEMVTWAQNEGDDSIMNDVQVKYSELKEKYERYEFYVLFSEKYDEGNAIISIHAGTGGVDAQDWAEILERMFLRFAERRKWKTDLIDRTIGAEAGIKSVTYQIQGRWAYGYFKSESGVHRLVRISPFDSEAMRHTSFALVEVIPELPEAVDIEISDSDIRIDVFRSSGPGGQSVNTTDSAVRIKHFASGIVVTCQNEKSQHQNKESALRILKSKLFKLQEEEREREERKIKGEVQKAEWGKQIRSYVMQPYKMVKDHRTQCETQDIDSVLNGDLERFMEEYLRWNREV